MSWSESAEALLAEQEMLGRAAFTPWTPPFGTYAMAGCFVCFPRGASGPGMRGDRGWAAAVLLTGDRVVATGRVTAQAGAPYEPGLIALREGELLEAAVRALAETPDAWRVASGRGTGTVSLDDRT